MEEMLEDTLDMAEDDEIEEEADAEVDKILFELTNGKLGEAATVTDLPVRRVFIPPRLAHVAQAMEQTEEDEETNRNMEKYRQQLNGLLSG